MEGEGRRSYLYKNRGHREQNLVYKVYWVPAWERAFTVKIGGLAWERFVEAKKHIDSDSKVMMWNDSACEEAFQQAKNRFWCEYNHPTVLDQCSSDPYVSIHNNTDCYSKLQQHLQDENLMLVPKEEFSQNRGTNNRILDFMLHPVANTLKKLLPRRATALTATSKSNL